MRAVRYHKPGDPSVLQIDDIDQPTPGSNEILVDIRAASINPIDAKCRQRGQDPMPKTTGSDFAGVVEAVGPDVEGFESGDRVCGTGLHTSRSQQGSFAEYAVVPTDLTVLLPKTISFEDGAAIALVGVTAWLGLVEIAGMKPTDTCLIHGGTGGVGHAAVQLSACLGAHTVTTVNPNRTETAESLGADVALSYERDDLRDVIETYHPDGCDVVFDHLTSEYFTFDTEVAAFAGTIIHYGGVRGEVELLLDALKKNLRVQFMSMTNEVTNPDRPRIASYLEPVIELVERDVLTPEIARTYTLDDAVEMHRAVLEDSFTGKLVLLQ